MKPDTRDFLFYIHTIKIEIDRIKSEKTKEKDQSDEMEKDNTIEMNGATRSLLQLINTISKDKNIQFDSVTQAAYSDDLINIVSILLKNDSNLQKMLIMIRNKKDISN